MEKSSRVSESVVAQLLDGRIDYTLDGSRPTMVPADATTWSRVPDTPPSLSSGHVAARH